MDKVAPAAVHLKKVAAARKVEVAEASEAGNQIDNVEVVEEIDTAAVELIELADYIARNDINIGLIASFKAEALNDRSTPRSIEQWAEDFDTQSNRVYK